MRGGLPIRGVDLAALLIDGDYPILCTYLQTMRKEAEQCVR